MLLAVAVPSRFVWLLLGGGIACGARTGLEVPDRGEGGGGSDLGGGGAGGEEQTPCEITATQSAHLRLPFGGSIARSLGIVKATSAPQTACVATDIVNEDGTWSVAHGCFDAWGPWPGSLGMAILEDGLDGGLAVAEGRIYGFALLQGAHGEAGARAALDVMPNASSMSWAEVSGGGNRAVFLTPGPGGTHFAGLSTLAGNSERLDVLRISAEAPVPLGEIACAQGPISASGVAVAQDLVVGMSSGREFDRCSDKGEPEAPTRLQVLSISPNGGTDLRFESVHDNPVTDVRVVSDGEDGVWAAWDAGGSVSLVPVGPGGPRAAAQVVTQGSRGSIALAKRGDSLLVAFVPAMKNKNPEVHVLEVVPGEAPRLFGKLDTVGSTWLRDLELLVDPVSGSVIVGYIGLMGPNERAFAKRFDCK
jgi:hypothetical protein